MLSTLFQPPSPELRTPSHPQQPCPEELPYFANILFVQQLQLIKYVIIALSAAIVAFIPV